MAAQDKKKSKRPATTLEAREQQVVGLAVDLAEEQIREGTASSQVITHFLKLGTTREQLEQERLRHETELLNARVEQIEQAKRVDELYEEALIAMRAYSGQEPDDPVDDYVDEYYED